MIKIRSFQPADTEAVILLWTACGLVKPWNDPHKDIERKLAIMPELFLVGETEDGTLIGSAMGGYEGHRGWINYLAVAPDQRRRGIAKTMMASAEKRLRALGCPKINLQVRRKNTAVINFYQAIGFGEDEVVSFGKRLR